ncbi:hypothetical protein DEALK_18550 [Dehalogenimonas alkenigignens]|uniref:Uncharacterized protein n=1 Tax=Dehalogenimonas alkenigignens TaxID=1217799 RepID=A0A0W0GKC2_9CHLR|nr:hypothetical protein [Dehalogenimonas alkenigignens]KTB49008.1 hypothetical protein DEALK_18550 [Dehalogenimonas alkenigignens]
MKKRRSLYDCNHARVLGQRIYCRRGYPLSFKAGTGSLDLKRLARGEPLVLDICQACPDCDKLVPAIPQEDRGWLKPKGGKK